MIGNLEVFKILSADNDLLTAMGNARGKKYVPEKIYLGQPDFTSFTDEKNLNQYLHSICPVIRIESLPDDEARYADDDRVMEFPSVEVAFWIKKEDLVNFETLALKTKHLLHKKGWERYDFNNYIDAETPSLRMVTAKYKYQGLPIG